MSNKLISSAVIQQSGIAFGTSGARGLAKDFTADVCAAFTLAFMSNLSELNFDRVFIAIDNRPTSYAMAQACAAAAKSMGKEYTYFGVIPTPALAFVAIENNVPAIMVTGSHIPFDRNGLKFYRPDGEITKLDEQNIINSEFAFKPIELLPDMDASNYATESYIARYVSLFDNDCFSGLRVGVYEHSSAGRDLYKQIFSKLGASVVSLGRSDSFVPIDTEAVSEEDKAKAFHWVKEHNLDLLFSTDGDGDRPLVTDEKGNWLRGDILGLLTAEGLDIEAIATPISSNTTIKNSERFKCVRWTKIGSPYVLAEFDELLQDYTSVAGFEANGGFMLGSEIRVNGKKLSALPTRDAVLPVIVLMNRSKEKKIEEQVASLPERYTYSDRIQSFSALESQNLLERIKFSPLSCLKKLGLKCSEIISIDETDGLRITFDENRIVHFRPSGNAPELRCYAESQTMSEAKDIVDTCLCSIKSVQ